MYKNVEIYAPASSGRSWLGRKIIEAVGDKISCVGIVDELLLPAPDNFVVGPKTREHYIMICLGFTAISPKDIADKRFTPEKQKELIEESKKWKEFAQKYKVQYFDVTKRDEKTYDDIVEWVKKQI